MDPNPAQARHERDQQTVLGTLSEFELWHEGLSGPLDQKPIQASGETNKVIGFPILSPRYRRAYRRLGFQDPIRDPDLLDAITRRVINATLQPARS